MSNVYDPLEVLTRAQKNADDWWSNTLANAKKRNELDQSMEDDAYKNDKRLMTYGLDLFKTNAENVFKGTKATYDTMLEPDRYDTQKLIYGRDGLRAKDSIMQLENALSPENLKDRITVYNDNFRSDAAKREAEAATAHIADAAERARVAGEIVKQHAGALGAQGFYGQNQRDANSLNIGNMISSGSFDLANEHMAKSGVNIRVESGDKFGGKPGTAVIVYPDGRRSAPVDSAMVAKQFNDMVTSKTGQAQNYVDKTNDQMMKNDQQMAMQNAKLADRKAYRDMKMQTEEGKRLNGALRAAEATGDKDKIQAAWNDVQAFGQRADMEFDSGNHSGIGTYNPGFRTAPRVSPDDAITGKPAAPVAPAAPAPAAPAALSPAAPAAAVPAAPAKTASKPAFADVKKPAAPLDPAEEVGMQLDKARAARSKIQADLRKIGTMERMKDRNGYDRLVRELDAAKLAEDELQRKYERMVYVAPYSPYTVPISK